MTKTWKRKGTRWKSVKTVPKIFIAELMCTRTLYFVLSTCVHDCTCVIILCFGGGEAMLRFASFIRRGLRVPRQSGERPVAGGVVRGRGGKDRTSQKALQGEYVHVSIDKSCMLYYL